MTAQHVIRGVGKNASGPSNSSSSAPAGSLEFREQPTVEAGGLEWGNEDDYDLTRFEPSTPSRAIDRLQNRGVNLIFNRV